MAKILEVSAVEGRMTKRRLTLCGYVIDEIAVLLDDLLKGVCVLIAHRGAEGLFGIAQCGVNDEGNPSSSQG